MGRTGDRNGKEPLSCPLVNLSWPSQVVKKGLHGCCKSCTGRRGRLEIVLGSVDAAMLIRCVDDEVEGLLANHVCKATRKSASSRLLPSLSAA